MPICFAWKNKWFDITAKKGKATAADAKWIEPEMHQSFVKAATEQFFSVIINGQHLSQKTLGYRSDRALWHSFSGCFVLPSVTSINYDQIESYWNVFISDVFQTILMLIWYKAFAAFLCYLCWHWFRMCPFFRSWVIPPSSKRWSFSWSEAAWLGASNYRGPPETAKGTETQSTSHFKGRTFLILYLLRNAQLDLKRIKTWNWKSKLYIYFLDN